MTRTNLLLIRATLLFAALPAIVVASQAQIQPPFDTSYTLTNLGSVPGVPGFYGGQTFLDNDNLLISGNSETSSGGIYRIAVVRDPSGHIIGFSGNASLYVTAPSIDGGLAFGPNGVLFFTAWGDGVTSSLGEIKPGSTSPDKTINLVPLGVCPSGGTLQFAPNGDLKLAMYCGEQFYTVTLSPDGSGTFDVSSVTPTVNTGGNGPPEGLVYVPAGSPVFAGPSLLVADWHQNSVYAYLTNASDDPEPSSGRFFASIKNPQGATLDPVTNDLMLGAWTDRQIYRVSGFAPPGGQGAVSLSPASLKLGSVVVGSAGAAKTAVLTNSGTDTLTIHQLAATGNYVETDTCTGAMLAPNATCNISVTLTPTVAATIAGAVTITDDALGSPHILALTGKGTYPITAAPASLNLGSQAVGGTSGPKTVTLTNNSTSAQGFSFVPSANYAVFGSGKTPCTGTLSAKAKCTLSVTFTPSANGTVAGALSIAGAGFPTQIIALTGIGTGGGTSPLSFSPATFSFSSTVAGTTSAAKTLTVTNSSASTLNITNFMASPQFSVIGTGTTPCGGSLAAGSSCTVAVTFSPGIAAKIGGALVFMDNDSVGTQVVGLSGMGVLQVKFTPASVTFSAQTVGTTSPARTITLTNNSNGTVNLLSTAASGNYSVVPGSKAPCGSSLAAKKKCTLSVTFTPTNKGAIKGAVTVTHDANGSPQVVGTSGTGQ